MREEAKDPYWRSKMDEIDSLGKILLGILNDILDFSKIDSGLMTIEQEPFNLNATIDQTVLFAKPLAEKKGICLTIDVANDVYPKRIGDSLRISQVLNNLLSNAIKFTDNGSVRVQVMQSKSKDGLTFHIADTGIGMTPEQIENILKPFTQADDSIARRFGGSGLGISIVNRLIGQMDGTFDISSEPAGGTQVTVHIPLPVAPKTFDEDSGILNRKKPEKIGVVNPGHTEHNRLQRICAEIHFETVLLDRSDTLDSNKSKTLTNQNLKDYRYLFLVWHEKNHIKRDDILLLQQIGKKVIIVAPQSELRQNDNTYNAADATISLPVTKSDVMKLLTSGQEREPTLALTRKSSKGKRPCGRYIAACRRQFSQSKNCRQNIFARWCPRRHCG